MKGTGEQEMVDVADADEAAAEEEEAGATMPDPIVSGFRLLFRFPTVISFCSARSEISLLVFGFR